MITPSRTVGDVLLAVFAVVVVAASVAVVQRSNDPVELSTLTQSSGLPVTSKPTKSPSVTAGPTATPTPTPRPDHSEGPETVVVAGPDLAKLGADLVAASGDTVLVAESDGEQPLAEGALAGIEQTPVAVVVQILAGSRTSVRTTDTIAAVRKRWPAVRVVVIGPFSSADRKSAAAVKAAAAEAKVTFLDPVTLKWRADDTKAEVAVTDFAAIAAKLAAALR